MNQTKFTPGPWVFAYGSIYQGSEVNDENANRLLMADRSNDRTMPTERDANCRLASKAPEMFEALKAVHSTYRTFRNVPKKDQQWTQLDDDAIALIESLLNSIQDGGGK